MSQTAALSSQLRNGPGLAYTESYLFYVLRPTGQCVPCCGEETDAETHVSTEANTAQAGAWIPEANVQPRRARGDQTPSRPRTATIDSCLNDSAEPCLPA